MTDIGSMMLHVSMPCKLSIFQLSSKALKPNSEQQNRAIISTPCLFFHQGYWFWAEGYACFARMNQVLGVGLKEDRTRGELSAQLAKSGQLWKKMSHHQQQQAPKQAIGQDPKAKHSLLSWIEIRSSMRE